MTKLVTPPFLRIALLAIISFFFSAGAATYAATATAAPGKKVTLSVTAGSGTSPFTYQWKKDGVNLNGATASTYVIASVQVQHAGNYSVIVSNAAGSTGSDIGALTVAEAPAFTTQPSSQAINLGNPVTFSVAASGTPAPTYQWQKNGVNIGGATDSSYTIANVATPDAGTYMAVATNTVSSVTSNGATLSVNVAPQFTLQPLSQAINQFSSVTFTASVTGTPAPTYQWRKNGVNIGGATSSSYTIASVATFDAGTYTVVATNVVSAVTSSNALLSVNVAPSITTPPVTQTVNQTNSVTFTAVASGTPAPTYQWRKDGVNIAGATNNSYTIASTTPADAGLYDVVATNVAGAATSPVASLTVQYAPVITTHPVSHFVTVGANVNLNVVANAVPSTITYQWKKNGVDIGGATSASYTLSNVQLVDSGDSYTVVATNSQGSTTSNPGVLTVTVASLTPVLGDFTNDGQPDILWRNTTTGAFALWKMNGTTRQSAFIIGAAPLDWEVAGTGDFNNDGQTDLVWRNPTTGTVAYWLMNGTALQSIVVTANVPTDWTIYGTGDFNNDGKVDILWRNPTTGTVAYWLMNGTAQQSVVVTTNVPTDWTIYGTGDFNNDGKVDILWRKPSTGDVAFWLMNGTTLSSVVVTANVPTDWTISGTGDYNADGKVDILWQNFTSGGVAFWLMNGTALQTPVVIGNIPSGWIICN